MRRRGGKAAVGPDIGLEPAVHRQVAPVGVIRGQQRRLLVVLLGTHGLGDERVPSVGANHDVSPLHDGAPAFDCPRMPTTRPSSENLLDDDVLADLGARFRCGVHQQLVEHGAPRAVRHRRVRCAGAPAMVIGPKSYV